MKSTALVLSGGGARGAYEVGVLAGLLDVLGRRPADKAPFQVFTGTSVGAINSAFFASHADQGDLAVDRLAEIWARLRLDTHLKWTPLSLWRPPRRGDPDNVRFGPRLLDPGPIEALVEDGPDWERLHRNVRAGVVSALIVAALDLQDGRTTLFAEVSEHAVFEPSRDPRRCARLGPVSAAHVLASAAIPVVFPVRRVGDRLFVDGSLRFNTPLSPAIRSGAERLVVVTLRGDPAPAVDDAPSPSLAFLLGKLLNALLLDPINYDLQVLERTNRLLDALEDQRTQSGAWPIDQVLRDTRGASYRRLETLVFRPSEDIGLIAGEYLRGLGADSGLGWLGRRLVRRLAPETGPWEADWATYLLFDGAYTGRLMELGRRDAEARADDIRAFFDER